MCRCLIIEKHPLEFAKYRMSQLPSFEKNEVKWSNHD
jgi:hypothetical protein